MFLVSQASNELFRNESFKFEFKGTRIHIYHVYICIVGEYLYVADQYDHFSASLPYNYHYVVSATWLPQSRRLAHCNKLTVALFYLAPEKHAECQNMKLRKVPTSLYLDGSTHYCRQRSTELVARVVKRSRFFGRTLFNTEKLSQPTKRAPLENKWI